MTIEEKAKEFYHKYRELNLAPESAAFNAALEMAEWKEQQMIEKAVEFLSKRVFSYDGCFIEDFKKAMKEK